MNTFLDWMRTQTHGITETARQLLYVLLAFDLLRNQRGEPWSDAQVAIVLSALSAILSLVTAKSTVAASKVQTRVDEARSKGYAEGVRATGTGSGAIEDGSQP